VQKFVYLTSVVTLELSGSSSGGKHVDENQLVRGRNRFYGKRELFPIYVFKSSRIQITKFNEMDKEEQRELIRELV
jgi:hypothetical protein